MKRIVLVLAMLMMLTGCASRQYTVIEEPVPEEPVITYIQPITLEGKQCIIQCKQLQMQQYQLAEQEYATARQEAYNDCQGYTGSARRRCQASAALNDYGNSLDELSRDIAKAHADGDYKECFQACGGTIEVSGESEPEEAGKL